MFCFTYLKFIFRYQHLLETTNTLVMAGGCCNVCGILGEGTGGGGRRRTRCSLHLELAQGATFPAALVLHCASHQKTYWVTNSQKLISSVCLQCVSIFIFIFIFLYFCIVYFQGHRAVTSLYSDFSEIMPRQNRLAKVHGFLLTKSGDSVAGWARGMW